MASSFLERRSKLAQFFGSAGSSVGQLGGKFGASNSKVGKWGEVEAGKFLRRNLEHDPHSIVFADLVPKIFEGGSNPNIDFLVLRGTSCLIIDAKAWSAGTYYSMPCSNLTFKGFPPKVAKGASKTSFGFTSQYMMDKLKSRGITSFRRAYLLIPPYDKGDKGYNLALWRTNGIEKWVIGPESAIKLQHWAVGIPDAPTPDGAIKFLKGLTYKK